MIKVLKKIFIGFVLIISLFILTIIIFMNTAPQFGRTPQDEHLEKISRSENYKNGAFQNQIETNLDMGFKLMMKSLQEFITAKKTIPPKALPVRFEDNLLTQSGDSLAYITWFGHSAIMLEMEGKRLFLDPMLGPASSPVSFLGKRFPYQQPIDLNRFENIDAIVISHDHYDHLDYLSIMNLAPKTTHFFVPLGVGAHLQRWGVDTSKITELDWWQSVEYKGIQLSAAPARHFSGRGFSRNKTQWASWIIKGKHHNIYFSGDSGYGPHFNEIGKKFGPFDFTMIECGQYNEKWEAIHMMPEQSVQANIDLQGKQMMPIHWGAFNLAVHEWTDPVDRLVKRAEEKNIAVISPYIGERFLINHQMPSEKWWLPLIEK